MNKKLPTKTIQGGYSDIRLWPCYMIISSLILFLTPIIGTFWSLAIVLTPFFIAAKYVADMQPVEKYDFEKWDKDFKNALQNKIELPSLENYKVIVAKNQSLRG